jgi:FixJ family two-component response regulator
MCNVRPGLGVVFATGYTAEVASLTSLVAKGACVIQKPFTATSLSRAIRQVLESSSSNVSR